MALGVWLVGDQKSGLLALACLAVGALFIALVAITFFFGADIALLREPKYRESYDLSYTDAGVTFRKSGRETLLPWSIYTHAVAHDHGWLLHHGRDAFTIIPARAFASEADSATFAAVVAAHVPLVERR